MKTLYLVRHAKSSWDYPELADHDRPLNHRGERDAPRMGDYLSSKKIKPDCLISSPAVRALRTAQIIAEKIEYKSSIIENEDVFHAGKQTLLQVVRGVDNLHQSAMLFGHNPGFTDFVNGLANTNIDNIPTAGVCQIDFEVKNWSEVGYGVGELIFFQYPKGL